MTYQFNFRADKEIVENVRMLCALKKRSMSGFVLEAVKKAYAAEIKKCPKLKTLIKNARNIE